MNEVVKAIHSRRSIRAYKSEQISQQDLETILDAAIIAPSAMNQQKWHFTVIQDQELLNEMVVHIKDSVLKGNNEFLKQRASTPEYHTFHKAPTVILVAGHEDAPWIDLDCGLATQNMVLTAETLNISSCIIATSSFLFAGDQAEEFKKKLKIPEGYKHICTIAFGYKNCDTPATPPRNKDVVSYIK